MAPLGRACAARNALRDHGRHARRHLSGEPKLKAYAASSSQRSPARTRALARVAARTLQDHVDKETGQVKKMPDGDIFTQPWPAGPTDKRRDHMIFYQYRPDRARKTLRGIDQQVAKAENAVAGNVPVTRNRFIQLRGGTKKVNRTLEAKARALAGIKGYTTNLHGVSADFVISAYHRLCQIETSFRMSKHDLQARPIYHHKRDSIDAHLTVVFAALAISRWIEERTGWSIKKFVRTTRRYRTIQIQAGNQTITAADPLPDALTQIHRRSGAH
jgi:hypothetical protein